MSDVHVIQDSPFTFHNQVCLSVFIPLVLHFSFTMCHHSMHPVFTKVKLLSLYVFSALFFFFQPTPSLLSGCPCTCSPCQTQLLLQTTWRAYKPHCKYWQQHYSCSRFNIFNKSKNVVEFSLEIDSLIRHLQLYNFSSFS